MQIIRSTNGTPVDRLAKGSIATIGVYDGLHLGHQKLLDRVLSEARDSGLPSLVMSFEPTPQEFFSPQNPPPRLMRFGEKCQALAEYGVDVYYCANFDAEMRSLTAEAFIQKVLLDSLKVRKLIVGESFHFGLNRSGNTELLEKAAEKLNFEVLRVPGVSYEGETVSSTAVRHALSSGDLQRAAELLGRPYRMSGEVVQGKHLGRKLGFPTANVNPDRLQVAFMGIFAARVSGLGPNVLDGVASLGTRPTVNGTKPLLEVHIFDFDEEIYGEEIQVDFIEKLRDEEKFDDLDALIEQMQKDATQARDILAKLG
ncbi:MAG: bifunctional riboflavin kinase/FAD synthetase [Gammaproteobacteria bacterium]|nr:bifunctional riboflavin kinase/FAD synthetase [Gammaproteobacteria bacterium]